MAILIKQNNQLKSVRVFQKVGGDSSSSAQNEAITDLTGTKWEFNSILTNLSNISYIIMLNFYSNDASYDRLYAGAVDFGQQLRVAGDVPDVPPSPPAYYILYYGNGNIAYNGNTEAWLNEAYRTIEITGGTDATNTNLIQWLQENATQIIEPTGQLVSISLSSTMASEEPALQCTVAGLGSSSPSSVTFTNNTIKDWTPETVVKDNITFVKFPTFYRKVNAVSSNQITSFTIANYKADDDYKPYPCFLDESGNLLPYILVEVDFISTSYSKIGAARTTARSYGTGYQLYDWMIHKLFQDLAICKLQTINTNTGSGITSLLGINWGSSSVWIDGVATPASGNYWVFSYKPSNYVDQPSSSTTGYQAVNYTRPTSTNYGDISKLGYDTSHPFLNYPNATVSNNSYNTYYCDLYYYSSGSHPVSCNVGYSSASYGVFHCITTNEWSNTNRVRLCYRPISN